MAIERNGDLAIVLLAELTAILPRHAHGMAALLWKACIIDDPGFNLPVLFEDGKRELANLAQNGLIGPGRLAHEMQKRLMLRRNPRRRRNCGQRLNALALAAGKQARTVIVQRPYPVAMADNFVQTPGEGRKTQFTLLQSQAIHIRHPIPMRESLHEICSQPSCSPDKCGFVTQ